jgi:hypothetical protein
VGKYGGLDILRGSGERYWRWKIILARKEEIGDGIVELLEKRGYEMFRFNVPFR